MSPKTIYVAKPDGLWQLNQEILPETFAAPIVEWDKTFGGIEPDEGQDVKQTSDGGYIIAGWTTSFGAGSSDIWLIKTDASGNSIWERTFGGESWDYAHSVQQTIDGGYIIVGESYSWSPGNCDIWLIRTDSSGNIIWSKFFGGLRDDYGEDVQQTADGGYIVTGSTWSFGSGDSDVWLIRTDSSGNKLWDQTFGGLENDDGYGVQETSGGDFIIVGDTQSFGYQDVWLIKTDASGNELWNNTFGGTIGSAAGRSVQQCSDGGYIISGFMLPSGSGYWDVWLIKTDAYGNKVWDKNFGGSDHDLGFSVQQTPDGGYIIGGYSLSFGAGSYDVWLVKTDSFGEMIWNKAIGGVSWDYGINVEQTRDGGFIVVGCTTSFGAGDSDIWLIKLAPPVSVVSKYWSTGDYQLHLKLKISRTDIVSVTLTGPAYLDTATVNKFGDPYSQDDPKRLYNDGLHWDGEADDTEWAVLLNLDTIPVVGDQITFHITYADLTTETRTESVASVLTDAPALVSPSDGAALATTTATFEWICSSQTGLTYSLRINDGNQATIYYTSGLPDGTTSHTVPEGYLVDGQAYHWLVEATDIYGNQALTAWRSFTISGTGLNCEIELREQGTSNLVESIDIGDFFDIYVGDSTGEIVTVRFLSDDYQNDAVDDPAGWTENSWDLSTSDWNHETKIKSWSFNTPGEKEIWVEVEDVYGQFSRNRAPIFASPGTYMPLDCMIELRAQGTHTAVETVEIREIFDIYVGDSFGQIAQARFLSDELQNGVVDDPAGWTEPFSWTESSGGWNHLAKKMAWSFATEGPKEIWVELTDIYGETASSCKPIYTGNFPVVIIPGTMGTYLYNDENNNGYPDFSPEWKDDELIWLDEQLILSVEDLFLKALQLRDDGGDYRNPCGPDDHSGCFRIDTCGIFDNNDDERLNFYGPLMIKLTGNGYSEQTNLFTLPYDWRKRIEGTAGAAEKLRDLVSTELGENARIDIVAHSMGGLVAREFARKNPGQVRKLIFLGTPQNGAPAAYRTFLDGSLAHAGILDLLTWNATIESLVCNWPGSHELLPNKRYRVKRWDTWHNTFLFTLNEPVELEVIYGPHNPDVEDLPGRLHVPNPYLNSQAMQFHDSFNFTEGGSENYLIMGNFDKGTIGGYVYVPLASPFVLSGPGDKTVPLQSALGMPAGYYNDTFIEDGVEHGDYAKNDAVNNTILSLLQSDGTRLSDRELADIGIRRYTGEEKETYIRIFVTAPGNLKISNSVGEVAMKLGREEIEEIPGSSFYAFPGTQTAYLTQPDDYQIEITSDQVGEFSLFIEAVREDVQVAAGAFHNVSITPESICSLHMNMDGFLSNLNMDDEADGIDKVISPGALPDFW